MMTGAADCFFALVLFASLCGASETWPADLSRAENLVSSAIGSVSYDRVDVRRRGRTLEISIGLENVPAQFRSSRRPASAKAEDEVFLATNFVQEFRGEEFALMPINAHLVDYSFGFWVFNFGKQIKLPAEIAIIGETGDQERPRFRKKKFKIRRRSLTLKLVEGQVSAPGFYALHTVVGPHSITTYFCNSCTS